MNAANGPETFALSGMSAGDLAAVRAFVRHRLTMLGCAGVIDALILAVDEVCANLIEHANSADASTLAWITVRGPGVDAVIEIEDEGPAFHPDDAPPPDLTGSWESRRVGGLGWFLVKQMVDVLSYESFVSPFSATKMRNRLTLIKHNAHSASHQFGDR